MPPANFSPNQQEIWERAQAAFQARDVAGAERLAEALPKSAEVLAFLGRVQAITGRLKLAADNFHKALTLDPQNAQVLAALFSLYSKQNALEPAIAIAKKQTSLQPQETTVWANLCDVLLRAGRFQEALDALNGALNSGANVADIRYLLGIAYFQMHRLDEARDQLRIAVDLAPERAEFWEMLGRLYVEMRNASAAHCFEKAAEVTPPGLAREMLRQKASKFGFETLEQAESWARQVIEKNPDKPGGYGLLSLIQQQSGKFDDAAKSLEKVIETDPETANSYFSLVNCRKFTKSDQSLFDRINAMLLRPGLALQDRMTLLFARGKALNDLGEYQQGLETFRKANQLAAEFYNASFDRNLLSTTVDHLIKIFTRDRLEQAAGLASELPVLVTGMMRSGTTLADRILSAHPQVSAAGELRYWRERIGDVRTFEIDPSILAQFGHEYLQILSKLGPGAKRVTDKNPANRRYLGHFMLAFPKGRIVHMRRHPVDNCLSLFMTPMGDPSPYMFDLDDLVFAYREFDRLMHHWKAVLPPDRFLEVSYENLVANTETEARRIVEFCGLPWDDACLRPEENRQEIRTASLWQARQPVYISSLDRWRRYEPWLGALRELLPPAE